MGTVWFVGAGPGDPDLITVKGRDLIAAASAILYAGSLVSEAALRWAPAGCEVADSKAMTQEAIAAWLTDRARQHETVVRLQTGDPSLYGALIEMVQPLDAAAIEIGVVPGVSSAMASAAAAVESLTLPEVTQTVILSRVAGRTPMPPGEELEALAAHRCTLCLFLSVTLLHEVQRALRAAGWPHCGGAEGELARGGEDRPRQAGGHQTPLSGREDRLPGDDHRQSHPGRPSPGRDCPFKAL